VTDGYGKCDEVRRILAGMKTEAVGLMLFVVGVGKGYQKKSLEEIGRWGNDGVLIKKLTEDIHVRLMYDCDEPGELDRAFDEIQIACSPKYPGPVKKKLFLQEEGQRLEARKLQVQTEQQEAEKKLQKGADELQRQKT